MSRLTAWSRWQQAAGPWRGWVVCPALTMPGAPRVAPSSASSISCDLADVLREDGTAVLLDLEPSRAVQMAADVSRRGLAHVVLVLPRWPHAEAVLPVTQLLATLLATSRQVRPNASANVVFVLDGERQRSVRRPSLDARIDNRYWLPLGELPTLQTLRAAGIRRVVKVNAAR